MGSAASSMNSSQIVDSFLKERVYAVSNRELQTIADETELFLNDTDIFGQQEDYVPPMHRQSYKISSDLGTLKSSKSLRALALRHHSKQENIYIPQELVSASFMLKKSLSGMFAKPNSSGSLGKKLSPSSSNGSITGENKSTRVDSIGPKKKPNLKIQIHDDPDWIQVSDDEGGGEDELGEMSPRGRESLTRCPPAQQSYLFTQSGTIFVDGFGPAIGKDGIVQNSSKEGTANNQVDGSNGISANGTQQRSKLPMCERLIVICKLGQGASSIVYKALDLL